MNVGMVIHSQTGHTDYVAHKIEDMLKGKGIKPKYMHVMTIRDARKNGKETKFKEMHDLSSYDLIVFGSHVEGFKLADEMQEYLKQMDAIEGKKAVCIVTQGMKFKFMGATKSLEQMSSMLEKKGAKVIGSGSMTWSGKDKREDKSLELAQKISGVVS